jgi:putative zinc finger/helix-turn-helix YgiT family protein
MKSPVCPKGHGSMKIKNSLKETKFRGVDITLPVESYVCPECGFEAGTIESAGAIQMALADAYRAKKGLLTGAEIKSMRKARGLSQQDLSKLMDVGIASIKRWETGLIQSRSMDKILRSHLKEPVCDDIYNGNREFSMPRIKLVIRTIEKKLGRRILKKNDKLLFAAKYLWYADMVAFKTLGRSMTGSIYAALPYGPQLNNYRDLVNEIMRADESLAETLTAEEIKIIETIAQKFPREQMVYDAAHRERIWQNAVNGALISYLQALDLTEV